jgi:hypothetical protein
MPDGYAEYIRERRIVKLARHVPFDEYQRMNVSFLEFNVKEIQRLFFRCEGDASGKMLYISVCLDNNPEAYGWFLPNDSRTFVLIYFRRRIYFLWRMDIPYLNEVVPRPGRGLSLDWGVGLVRWDNPEQKEKLAWLQLKGAPRDAREWVKAQLLPTCSADWASTIILPRRERKKEGDASSLNIADSASSPAASSHRDDHREDPKEDAMELDR